MSLITCPECGKQISEFAQACPNCGYPTALIKNKYQPAQIPKNRFGLRTDGFYRTERDINHQPHCIRFFDNRDTVHCVYPEETDSDLVIFHKLEKATRSYVQSHRWKEVYTAKLTDHLGGWDYVADFFNIGWDGKFMEEGISLTKIEGDTITFIDHTMVEDAWGNVDFEEVEVTYTFICCK